jgi:hypothetical protein
MVDEPKTPELNAETLRALARETGATEDEIRQIVALVGLDRSSILREARALKGKT